MPTELTVQVVPQEGELEDVTMTAADATNGNDFANDGKTFLLIDNTDGSSQTVTITSVADPFGRTQDLVVTTAAGAKSVAGPFTPAIWNGSGGKVVATASNVAVELAAIRITPRS